jgi:curved DNA-binding protein CbpA
MREQLPQRQHEQKRPLRGNTEDKAMKSAYLVLGVPGNASDEDVDIAYKRAELLFTPDRLSKSDGAVDRFNELKTAYKILKDPASRAAHDRKLASAQAKPKPTIQTQVVEEESTAKKLLKAGVALLIVLFAAGFFISYKNAETARAHAALELARKQQDAKEEEQRRIDAERADNERAMAKAKAEADERRFDTESRMAGTRATIERQRQEYISIQAQRNAAAEVQRQETAQRMQEQRDATEARRRVEADKRRIRELCWQQYRKTDC